MSLYDRLEPPPAEKKAPSMGLYDKLPESERPAPPVEFDAATMARNIPGSALQLGKDLVQPLIHPVQTAEAIGGLAVGLRDKAVRGINEYATGRDLPKEPSEAAPDAVGEFFNSRYRSVDGFKKTAMDDPIGVLADIASIVVPVGSLTKSAAIQKAAAVVDPINATVNATKYVAGKMVPDGLPEKLYQSAAKFSTAPGTDRASLIKTALENGYMPTAKGMEKLSAAMNDIDALVEQAIAQSTSTGGKVPRKRVFEQIRGLIDEYGDMNLDAAKDQKIIRKIVTSFSGELKKQGKSYLTPDDLQKLKRKTYKKINWSAQNQSGSMAKADTRKAIANAAMKAIEELVPEVGPLNQRWGDLLELSPNLQRATNRIDNLNNVPLSTAPNVVAGTVLGDQVGAAAGMAASILEFPKVKAWLALKGFDAKKKANLARMLEANPAMQERLLASVQAGRATDNDR